jgi:hypothetical protein
MCLARSAEEQQQEATSLGEFITSIPNSGKMIQIQRGIIASGVLLREQWDKGFCLFCISVNSEENSRLKFTKYLITEAKYLVEQINRCHNTVDRYPRLSWRDQFVALGGSGWILIPTSSESTDFPPVARILYTNQWSDQMCHNKKVSNETTAVRTDNR